MDSTCKLLTLVTALCTISGCSGIVRESNDELCSELNRYLASTANVTGPSRVILRGGWGGERPETLMTHDCRFEGSASGQSFCAYLRPNTSWEFGNYNVSRVAKCLQPGTARDRLSAASESNSNIKISTIVSAVPTIELSIDYVNSDKHGLSVLTLQAESINDR
jgi:hypothetical protein